MAPTSAQAQGVRCARRCLPRPLPRCKSPASVPPGVCCATVAARSSDPCSPAARTTSRAAAALDRHRGRGCTGRRLRRRDLADTGCHRCPPGALSRSTDVPDGVRAEMDEYGELLLAPLPTTRHQRIASQVAIQMQSQLGGEAATSLAVNTRIGVRVPDVCCPMSRSSPDTLASSASGPTWRRRPANRAMRRSSRSLSRPRGCGHGGPQPRPGA
jgi:hypothetical protein